MRLVEAAALVVSAVREAEVVWMVRFERWHLQRLRVKTDGFAGSDKAEEHLVCDVVVLSVHAYNI